MHLIGKNAKVRAAAKTMVAADGGDAMFRAAQMEAANQAVRLFKAEHGASPHESWLSLTEGPGMTAGNIREARASVEPPTSATEVLVNGERRALSHSADERTRIPIVRFRGYAPGSGQPIATPTAATFDGWDADTGLMVFTAE